MPKKLEAYGCGTCKGIILGSLEDALAHEAIPVDKPLPAGLVYTFKKAENKHYVIGKSELSELRTWENEVIEDFDNQYYHGLSYVELAFCSLENSDVVYYGGNQEGDSKNFRKCLNEGDYNLLTDDEFERFKKLIKEDDLEKWGGLRLEDLTNKLKKPELV